MYLGRHYNTRKFTFTTLFRGWIQNQILPFSSSPSSEEDRAIRSMSFLSAQICAKGKTRTLLCGRTKRLFPFAASESGSGGRRADEAAALL